MKIAADRSWINKIIIGAGNLRANEMIAIAEASGLSPPKQASTLPTSPLEYWQKPADVRKLLQAWAQLKPTSKERIFRAIRGELETEGPHKEGGRRSASGQSE